MLQLVMFVCETVFLFQRLSVIIQCYNSACPCSMSFLVLLALSWISNHSSKLFVFSPVVVYPSGQKNTLFC